jgi:hypothetical protein
MIKIKSLDAKDKNTLKVNKCQCHKVDKATTKTKSSKNLHNYYVSHYVFAFYMDIKYPIERPN